jgi:hypothetical protein
MLVIVSRHLKRISRTQIGSEALAAKRRLLPDGATGGFAGVLHHFEEAVAILAKSLTPTSRS